MLDSLLRLMWIAAIVGLLGACSEFDTIPAQTGEEPKTDTRQVSEPDLPQGQGDEDVRRALDARLDPEEEVIETPDTPVPELPATTTAEADLVPENVHLSYQNSPATTLVAQWKVARPDTRGYVPKVWYAPNNQVQGVGEDARLPYGPGHVVEGICERFDETVNPVTPSPDLPLVACHAEMTGLIPNTEYVYRAGTWEWDEGSQTFSSMTVSPAYPFRSGITKGERTPFRFIAAGDSRGGYVSIQKHAERLNREGARFWIFNGDMNNKGTQAEWDQWFTSMKEICTVTSIMPVQGNHEKLAEVYYKNWVLPRMENLADEYIERNWAFTYGNVRVIGLDSNTEFTVVSAKPFLEVELAKASQDPDIDWIIVQYHHPAYSASTSHGSTTRVQKIWVPLFEKYGVDLSFSGHDHDYERTVPIRNNQEVTEGGVVYVVAGAFFAPGYTNGKNWFTKVSHHGSKANYVILDVNGKTLNATAYSGDGTEVLDQFTLTK
jgi:predicted phosphodiesterase